ncbi:MAG: helix-turn-helix domain-containing protein [Chitinivibrionales bacterium]|nr:helix-turn-helix domain-containing protein [Chitinivibrionales bacterium]
MQEQFFRLRFRPSESPRVPLPFGVRSVGHACRGTDYVDAPVDLPIVQLLWGVRGRGEVLHEGRLKTLTEGQLAWFGPNQRRYWRSVDDPWVVRWITLDGDHAAEVFALFDIPPCPHDVGPCPEGLFEELERMIHDVSPSGERAVSALGYTIVCRASSRGSTLPADQPMVARAADLIERHLADPRLNVDWVADRLCKHRSLFSREFKRHRGIAPADYIISLRIQRAMELLQTTHKPVRVVAAACGFVDSGYFCRAFKRVIGVSPGKWRRGR